MAPKSKFDEKLHPPLIRWMARAGLIDQEICEQLKIAKTTLYRWAGKHEAVAEALKESRDYVDSLVEESLLKRALGYEVEETKAYGVRGKDGATVERFEKVKKHIPADTTACIFWTKCRRRPKKGMDARFVWQEVTRIEVDPGGLDDTPAPELSNAELEDKIGRLERAIGVLPGAAATPCGPGEPDFVH